MSDLKTLFPAQHIDLAGRTITVKPFTFGQLPKVLTKARTVYGAIAHLIEKDMSEAGLILEVMAVGGEDLMDLVCLSIGEDRDFLDTLQIDEGVKLVGTFLEVNLSFFVQRVLPEFKDAMAKVQAATGAKS